MQKDPSFSPPKQGLEFKCCLSLLAKVRSVALGKFDSSSNKDRMPKGFCRIRHMTQDEQLIHKFSFHQKDMVAQRKGIPQLIQTNSTKTILILYNTSNTNLWRKYYSRNLMYLFNQVQTILIIFKINFCPIYSVHFIILDAEQTDYQ